MKFLVSDDGFYSRLLEWKLGLEGHSIVEKGGDIKIRKKEVLPKKALEGLGLSLIVRSNCRVTSWFDASHGWTKQAILTIPMIGMMNDGLGKQVETGSIGTFVEEDQIDSMIPKGKIEPLLREMGYVGLVTIHRLSTRAETEVVSSIELGELGIELFSFLEGARPEGYEWFRNQQTMFLKESWTSNLLVSRSPFPLESDEIYKISGITESVEKHLWMTMPRDRNHSQVTMDTSVIGLISNWGRRSKDAIENSLWTARNLQVPEIQYRTDQKEVLERETGKMRIQKTAY